MCDAGLFCNSTPITLAPTLQPTLSSANHRCESLASLPPTTAPTAPTIAPSTECPIGDFLLLLCICCVLARLSFSLAPGANGCSCTSGGYCDRDYCIELTCYCPIGKEKCPCTVGGGCDVGLQCVNGECYLPPTTYAPTFAPTNVDRCPYCPPCTAAPTPTKLRWVVFFFIFMFNIHVIFHELHYVSSSATARRTSYLELGIRLCASRWPGVQYCWPSNSKQGLCWA